MSPWVSVWKLNKAEEYTFSLFFEIWILCTDPSIIFTWLLFPYTAMQTHSLEAFLYFPCAFNTLKNVFMICVDIDTSYFLSNQRCLCFINICTAFYMQICILIRKILCLFQAPDIPALPFTKGQSLDPTASNPIRQLFRHTSEIVSRLSDIHNMKHVLVKITISF